MTPDSGTSKATRALTGLTDLAHDSVMPPVPARLDQGLQTLSLRLAAGKARRTALLRWSLVGAMATASVLGIVWFSRGRLPAPVPPALAYQIEGGTLVDGGYLRESGRSGIKLFFAEGTEFVLMPGTRGRLRTVDHSGARIAIEHGAASFQVTPRNDGKWLVEVGPFLVTVKGTVFTVSWDAARERFELKLRHGHVTVSGPISGGDIALRTGQQLVVNLSTNESVITEQKTEETWDESAVGPAARAANLPKARPAAASERPAGKATTGASLSVAPKVEGEHGWAESLPATVVDTTGAGDLYAAGFLTGYTRGRPLDSGNRLERGSLCARRCGPLSSPHESGARCPTGGTPAFPGFDAHPRRRLSAGPGGGIERAQAGPGHSLVRRVPGPGAGGHLRCGGSRAKADPDQQARRERPGATDRRGILAALSERQLCWISAGATPHSVGGRARASNDARHGCLAIGLGPAALGGASPRGHRGHCPASQSPTRDDRNPGPSPRGADVFGVPDRARRWPGRGWRAWPRIAFLARTAGGSSWRRCGGRHRGRRLARFGRGLGHR